MLNAIRCGRIWSRKQKSGSLAPPGPGSRNKTSRNGWRHSRIRSCHGTGGPWSTNPRPTPNWRPSENALSAALPSATKNGPVTLPKGCHWKAPPAPGVDHATEKSPDTFMMTRVSFELVNLESKGIKHLHFLP